MQALWLGLLIGAVAVAIAAVAAPTTVERAAGSIQVRAAVAASSFAVAVPIAVTISIKNTASTAVSVVFPSGQRYDVIARRPRGDEVWRWSHDRAFIQVVQTVALNPGEELTYRVTWDQRDLQGRQVDPGVYELVAVFLGQVAGARQPQLTLPPLTITIR